MGSMDFREFCEKTKHIVIVKKHNRTTGEIEYIHDYDYMLNPVYAPGAEPVPVHGLYFPNDREIADFCEDLGGDLFYSKYKNTLSNMKTYFCNRFVKRFKETLNIQFENNPFEELDAFLKEEKKSSSDSVDVPKLTEIIGRMYEKTRKHDLLESDIRINALGICPEINVIGHFEKIEVGYIGLGFIVPKNEIKSENQSKK